MSLRPVLAASCALGLIAALAVGCASTPKGGVGAPPADGERARGATAPEPAPEPAAAPLRVIEWEGELSDRWKEVERLEGEQKFEAAWEVVQEIVEAARGEQRSQDWVKGLIRSVQLRTALHGYETSVRYLKDQPWPEDLLGRTVLNLFYGRSLVTYAQAYSWEIRQREKVEVDSKGGEVDLKKWTLEQLHAEANRAYFAAWQQREGLGEFPISVLGEYVDVNNYPEGVRPTLRDAVSYLWVELIADRAGWRPEHANEVYRLDLAGQLLPGDAAVSVIHPEVHPVRRIAAVLGDLEAWHRAAGHVASAFEARLARYRVLQSAFTQEIDRAVIKADLQRALKGVRADSWWAMGMHQLAEMVQAESAPDALIRARALAVACRDAYPKSPGGDRCRYLIETIDMPAVQLQAMSHDAAGKRSIGVQYKNLEQVWLRAYRFDLVETIEAGDDYNLFPNGRELERLLAKRKPAHTWQASLPATSDYRMHREYLIPPMKERGYWVVVASARADFAQPHNQLIATHMVIGDLVLITRGLQGDQEAHVLSGDTGEPVVGADVHLYQFDWRKGHKRVSTRTTGDDGSVRFHVSPGGQHFLIATHDGDIALDPSWLYFHRPGTPRPTSAALIYTDRSIYRPLQTLHWKVVAYQGRQDLGKLETSPKASVTVYLKDPNGEVVGEASVKTNEHGTASGEFIIPTGRLLGSWRLETSPGGSAQIKVEEYKRPTFEAKLLPAAEEALRLNRPAKLTGEARYYFGLPVTGGKVAWRVTRTPVYPWWWSSWYWWRPAPATAPQTVGSGVATLDDEGHFQVEFTPAADERQGREVSYTYAVLADVTDEGGETRTARRSFRLGFVAVEARVDLATGFLTAGQADTVKVVRTNLDGDPAAGAGSWRLVRLEGPSRTLLPADQPMAPRTDDASGAAAFRTEGDALRPRWQPGPGMTEILRLWGDGAQVGAGQLAHGEDGAAEAALPALEAGAYRLHYETKDAFGETYSTTRELVVAAPKMGLQVPAALVVERSSVRVGGTARLLVHSGLEGQPLFFDIFQGGVLRERRRLRTGADASVLELPVTEQDRGGFGVTLWVLRDHQLSQLSQTVHVPWDDRELKVELASFRDKLRPGAKETWTVKVTGPAGADSAVAAAEVLAYMFDRSLDVFAPHSPPSPLALYPWRASVVWARSNLGQARQSWLPADGFPHPVGYGGFHGDTLQFYSGYGIGGPGARGRNYKGAMGGAPRRDGEGMPPPSPAPRATVSSRSEATPEPQPVEEAEVKVADDSPASTGDDQGPGGEQDAGPQVELRSDFSETAFWEPHLLTGEDGSVSFEFEVPDSVTSWNVWLHAVTRDMKGGSVRQEVRTVKDLMVRPYLPRFVREGDQATLKVVVNNASEGALDGTVDFDILDPATDQSLLSEFGLSRAQAAGVAFSAPAGGGTHLSFAITVPPRVGTIAFEVIARTEGFSDGELRPLPVLPGRMHLVQSRFVALRDHAKRTVHFADLAADDDPTRIDDQMVVTVDGQLFYSVLSALPYLIDYPYECTEQTMNRFLSTGILSSLYGDYPAIAKMAKQMSQRDTPLESWDADDPNRRMALEETPWLAQSRGGAKPQHDLVKVLDPRVASATRRAALAKLRKAQTSSGGFPWFPGGPPSPYITLYLAHGFSKAIEFGVDVPRDMVQRAWSYLHRHYIHEVIDHALAHDCCWESITFLNYVLSNYPDASWTGGVFTAADRKTMIDFSFKHWKQHAPYLKGYLALTLQRMSRAADARRVWESVLDSAKETEDQGTFWAPEDRGWLWYNDTIETHAFAVRTTMELDPAEDKLDGMVLWLFLNKKLNHWKSTRATAEVLYSLAHYLKANKSLGIRETTKITWGDDEHELVFEPDDPKTRKQQIVVAGADLDPKKHSTVVIEKETKGFQLASATWHFSTERLPAEARGDFLAVTRTFFKRVKTGREVTLQPLADGARLQVGDEVEVHVSLTSEHALEYVHLRDPRGAGFEPTSFTSKHKWDLGISWYEEIRDSGTHFFFERLPHGEYTFKYRLRASIAGAFKVAPATVQPMYAPEFAAYSSGEVLTIAP